MRVQPIARAPPRCSASASSVDVGVMFTVYQCDRAYAAAASLFLGSPSDDMVRSDDQPFGRRESYGLRAPCFLPRGNETTSTLSPNGYFLVDGAAIRRRCPRCCSRASRIPAPGATRPFPRSPRRGPRTARRAVRACARTEPGRLPARRAVRGSRPRPR